MKIAKEGVKIIFPSFLLSFTLAILMIFIKSDIINVLFIISLFLFGFTIYFFRDPERIIPGGDKIIVSPADGRIIKIEEVNDHFCGNSILISIFMSLFDVHVNRAPLPGTVKKIEYKEGKFIAAYKKKADKENEKNVIYFNNGKYNFVVKQIAGVIARRIVSYVCEDDKVLKGQRIGMIMFGSRVDLIIPITSSINVSIGQKVKAGQTIIGEIN
ncbi:MAG: phosphatidylserine decarboxylase family protein [Candidatus Marinimicrobia bacterium]|nr:phosphatidylserine decarboxylase family protein [Candidatus Neomarinimicrobiota bacterium]